MEHLAQQFGHWRYGLPRLLLAGLSDTLSVMAALLNHSRSSRFFYYPPLIVVELAIIYPGIIGTFFIPA
jgi:hypothetical protein